MPLAVSWPGWLDILPQSKEGQAGMLGSWGGQSSDVLRTGLPGDSLQGCSGASPSSRMMVDVWKGKPELLTHFMQKLKQDFLRCP